MKLVIYNRDFTDLVVPPNLDFSIDRYSWTAQGGPKMATISASGDVAALFELVNHLRAPVEILNDLGEAVWWGYISALQIPRGAIQFGVDLDTMSNNIAVAYTDQDIRYTTQWSGDAESISVYGTKEKLLSVSDVTATEALQRRDTYLQAAKRPTTTIQTTGRGGDTAMITCQGWLYTLDWRYYLNLTGKESYEDTGDGGREIGEDDRPILGQSFQIASTTAWTATSLWLRPWKQGDSLPSDNLVVSLKSDNAGEPGTTLAACAMAAGDIGQQADWLEFPLSASVTLQPGTTYWIHITRSGAVDADAYYMVDTNRVYGYPRGSILLYNTNLSAWVVDTGNWGDLLFKIVGKSEITGQITALVTYCGEFLQGTIIEDVSGVDTNPYRSGDSLGLYELEQMLATGTINDRRLLCEVTRNRYLRVYEEPAMPANAAESLALTKDGVILSQYLTMIDPTHCPVGVWCHLADVIPVTVDLSVISDPNLFFVEEGEVNAKTGEYTIVRTRNQSDIWSIGGTEQG